MQVDYKRGNNDCAFYQRELLNLYARPEPIPVPSRALPHWDPYPRTFFYEPPERIIGVGHAIVECVDLRDV